MTNTAFHLRDWRQVAEGVYVAVADPASVNIGLVIGTDAALIVDTGSSPEQGAAIREAATRFTDRPLAGAVVTHAHFDHAFGIAGFAGLDTVGHESLPEELTSSRSAAKAAELGFDPAALRPPSRTITIAGVVPLGGNRVAEFIHLGPAHSAGDLAISVSDADVIFAGDLIETAGPPWFGPDSAPEQWPWAVDQLATLAGAQTRIIPGHGDPIDRGSVLEQRDQLDAVRSEIERLFEAGVAAEDAPAAGEWPIPVEHVAGGIPTRYATLRDAAANTAGPEGRRTLPMA